MSTLKPKSNLFAVKIASTNTNDATAKGMSLKNAEKAFSAGFAKMKLKSYALVDDGAGNVDMIEEGEMDVIVNPESYKKAYADNGEKNDSKFYILADGKIRNTKVVQFNEKLSFDLWFDSTGVFPECKDVDQSIAKFSELFIQYYGAIHSARYVQIMWGNLDFLGQLDSVNIDYLYFNRNGSPLRAKMSVSFTEFKSAVVKSKEENDQSPDLTHSRIVKDGDNLPLMCYRIYKDPSYYLQVAEANDLAHFTDLKPGQRIFFPPLEA